MLLAALGSSPEVAYTATHGFLNPQPSSNATAWCSGKKRFERERLGTAGGICHRPESRVDFNSPSGAAETLLKLPRLPSGQHSLGTGRHILPRREPANKSVRGEEAQNG